MKVVTLPNGYTFMICSPKIILTQTHLQQSNIIIHTLHDHSRAFENAVAPGSNKL